jgi:transposase
MLAKPDLTLDDLVLEVADGHGVKVHRVSVWRVLRSLGLTNKKRPPSRRTEAASCLASSSNLDHTASAFHA